MLEDFLSTLKIKYDLTDALSGVCTLCGTRDRVQKLEVYQHREITAGVLAVLSGVWGLFQVHVVGLEEDI